MATKIEYDAHKNIVMKKIDLYDRYTWELTWSQEEHINTKVLLTRKAELQSKIDAIDEELSILKVEEAKIVEPVVENPIDKKSEEESKKEEIVSK